MRQETVTELRDRSVLMDAFKKTKVGYFTEFYKWNRCLATILGVVIFILFVIVTSLLFIFNEAATRIEYVCQNLSLSIIFLSVLIIILIGYISWHIKKNRQEIVSAYNFNPAEIKNIKQISYLRFKNELYSINYLTGNQEADAQLLSLYISWLTPSTKITIIEILLAAFSSIVIIFTTKDLATMLFTLSALMITFALFKIVSDMTFILKQNQYLALEFVQSLYAENALPG